MKYIIGPRSGKTGLNDNIFDFRFSTFSIVSIFLIKMPK